MSGLNPVRVLFAIAWSAAVLSCANIDLVEKHYGSYDEAVADGAVKRGWIPGAILPESARNIFESHSMDTNEVWLTFTFAAEDLGSVMGNCSSESAQVRFPRQDISSGLEWWPRDLIQASSSEVPGYLICRVADHGGLQAFLAVARGSKTAYYWSRAAG